jgi:hypothetical protein
MLGSNGREEANLNLTVADSRENLRPHEEGSVGGSETGRAQRGVQPGVQSEQSGGVGREETVARERGIVGVEVRERTGDGRQDGEPVMGGECTSARAGEQEV